MKRFESIFSQSDLDFLEHHGITLYHIKEVDPSKNTEFNNQFNWYLVQLWGGLEMPRQSLFPASHPDQRSNGYYWWMREDDLETLIKYLASPRAFGKTV